MTTYWFDSSPFTLYGEFNPIPLTTTTESGHTVKQLNASQSIRFRSDSASVAIKSYFSVAAGRKYVLLRRDAGDGLGVEVGSVDIPASGGGAYDDFQLATGLDTGSEHEYEILCVLPIQGAVGNWYDAAVILDDDSLAAVAHPNRPVLGFYGDSNTGITNAPPDVVDTRDADMWQACQANGQAMFICGVAGGKVVNTGRDNTGNVPPEVSKVVVRYGGNDVPDFPSGDATYVAAYNQMILNLRAQVGDGKEIICEQPFARVGWTTEQAHVGELIQTAIEGLPDVRYVSTEGWFPVTTDYLPDNTHLGKDAFTLVAIEEAPYLLSQGDALILNQTANSDPVTELWKRAAVVAGEAGTPTEEIIQHSTAYPRQPDNGYVYAKHGSAAKHVFVFGGTITLEQAIAARP